MALDLTIRPITVDEYHRMAAAGIINPGERVELLDGLLVTKVPIGWAHSLAQGLIVEYLIRRLGSEYFVSGEASIPLPPRDEPEPDVTIFRREIVWKRSKAEWSAADIVALVEVADSST